jgi:hypothetical protein
MKICILKITFNNPKRGGEPAPLTQWASRQTFRKLLNLSGKIEMYRTSA